MFIAQLIPSLVMLVGLVIGFSFAPRTWTKTPRENRQLQRRTALFLVPVFGINVYFAFERGSPLLVAVWVLVIGVWGWTVFRGQTIAGEREARINFAVKPGRCGRCDYDLTGNATGVCPECGWDVPPLPIKLQSPAWHVWWRGWTIDHLDDARRTLRATVVFALVAAAGAIVAVVWRHPMFFVLGAAMAVHGAVNVVRVLKYQGRAAAVAAVPSPSM